MLIKSALLRAKQQFKKSDSAQLDAEVLLSFVINKPKEFLYAHPEVKLNWIQKIRFFYLVRKRAKDWPVAGLTGRKEFYGRPFYVDKHVLIPRPLTEELIDETLKIIKKIIINHQSSIIIADIGTGSGNIIITLIKELQKQKFNLDNFKFYATDISAKALLVAKKNARLHKVNQYIKFFQGNLLKPLQNLKIDLILANLPYLDKSDLTEPSIQKEPRIALLGNYDQFFKQVYQLNPQPIVIFEDKTGIYSTSCQV